MDGIRDIFASNLRRIRNHRRMSQEELAFQADIDRSYVSGLEAGKRNPTILVVERVARALGVKPYELLTPPVVNTQE